MAETKKGRVSGYQKTRSRELQVIELRRAHYDWDTVAAKVSPPYKSGDVARQVWKRAMERRTAEYIDEVREQVVETVTGVIQTFYPLARKGDDKAAGVLLKAVDKLGKYFPGLESTEVNMNIKAPPTVEETEAFLLGAHEAWLAHKAQSEKSNAE